ncbi:MAG: antibiotic biosynthesis monooxygenase family protein [Pseudomonadota bacterium]
MSDASARRERETVVLINTFMVPGAMEDAFLQWWRIMKPLFAMQPGFVSAKLHRSLDQGERYRFVNIAEWESTEAYRHGLSAVWSAAPKPGIPGLDWRPALYEVIEEA